MCKDKVFILKRQIFYVFLILRQSRGKRLNRVVKEHEKAPSIGGLFLTLPIYHTYLAIDANT